MQTIFLYKYEKIAKIVFIEFLKRGDTVRVEQINENTIKVMIGKTDLEERGITFFDLLGSQQQVESFFYEILDEVGVREQFEGLDAVTFQVVPKSDGLDLYISKGMNEGLKDHLKSTLQSSLQDKAASDTPLDKLMHLLEGESKKQKDSPKQDKATKRNLPKSHMYTFDTFFDFLSFAQSTIHLEVGKNTLCHYDNNYYWIHVPVSEKQHQSIHYCAIEHGVLSPVAPIVIKEHGNTLVENNAVATILNTIK